MSDALINDRVLEVLQDTLHETEDDELQAAIWQALDGVAHLANTVETVRWAVR